MSRELSVTYFMAVLCLAGLVGCERVGGGSEEMSGASAEDVTRFTERLRADLPPGTSKSEIDEYLRDLPKEFSWVERESYYVTMFKEVEQGLLVTRDIQVRILLDDEGKLAKIIQKDVMTGL